MENNTTVKTYEEVMNTLGSLKKAVTKVYKGLEELNLRLGEFTEIDMEASLATAQIEESQLDNILNGFEWVTDFYGTLATENDMDELKRIIEVARKYIKAPAPVEQPPASVVQPQEEPIIIPDIVNPIVTIELPEPPLEGQDVSDNGEQPQGEQPHHEHHENGEYHG